MQVKFAVPGQRPTGFRRELMAAVGGGRREGDFRTSGLCAGESAHADSSKHTLSEAPVL